jgi:uncharacterized RDD family membrane protein YckC
MASAPVSGVSAAPAVAGTEPTLRYAGLVTRAISFAADAAVINLAATVVGVGAALILSLLHLPKELKTVLAAIGGVAYVLWLVGYFVVFWSTTGQTPGARIMQIRVQTANGDTLRPRRAMLRVGGLLVAALPLFAGFVPVLYDERRRAFQDRLAGTVVVDMPALSFAASLRARKRAQYVASRPPPPGLEADIDGGR